MCVYIYIYDYVISYFVLLQKLESESQSFQDKPADSWPNEGRIIFSNVEMKYRDDMDPVLNEIKFDIHPVQKVGIVGRTGAGSLLFFKSN